MKHNLFQRMTGFFLKVLLPLLILLLAVAGAYALMATAPRAHKKKPEVIAPTVETGVFERKTHAVRIPVMGTVIAAREITLDSRLDGEVVSVSKTFVPGGFFEAGEEILRLDPRDYQLTVSEMEAEVVDAQYSLKVEQGYQKVAGREWDLLKNSSNAAPEDADLALRKPHLAKAKADLSAARAQLRQARLDLQRTRITAPFAAMVETKSTDLGASITSQEALATLVGTDEFWVEASVPVDRLDRIAFPSREGTPGSAAVVVTGSNGHTVRREGRVIRLLPSLETEGRMARVLISIKDPLNLAGDPEVKPILLGSYAKVFIDGGSLPDSFAVPRTAFRDNDRIWVLDKNGTLDIRKVSPLWRDEDFILLDKGLAEGERVVLSSLSTPVQGMRLRTVEETTAQAEPYGGGDIHG